MQIPYFLNAAENRRIDFDEFLKLIKYHCYRSLRRKTHNRFKNLRKAFRLTVNRKSKLRFKLFLIVLDIDNRCMI